MVIALLLLHALSYVSKAKQPRRIMGYPEEGTGIELPTISLSVAWKLTPLISIGILGLAFNTLCLRDVDASFFQVSRLAFCDSRLVTQKWSSDCARVTASVDYRHHEHTNTISSSTFNSLSRSYRDGRLLLRRLSLLLLRLARGVIGNRHKSGIWHPELIDDFTACNLD